jgi:glucose-6-phosphate isomerase
MTPNQDPFTTWVDLRTGELEPERDLAPRDLTDMPGYFLEQDGAENRVVYRVSAIPVPPTNDEIASSTTVISPGTVGREYHMTKGHFHANWRRSEIYIGLAGEGLLLLATADGDHRAEPLRAGSINYIPGGWAHRSVNTGSEPLVFLATYIGDAGYDYGTIAERGFPVIVVEGDDGQPAVVSNPRYRNS